MKIKNILALGLIAIVSGINTAQTYNATAGTSGVTDIQSDYSIATGDGASVSVDVPLEFELPKKVALAIKDDDNTFTNNPLFSGVVFPAGAGNTIRSFSYDGLAHGSGSVIKSQKFFKLIGSVYTNTDNTSISTMLNDFIHESDSNSVIGTCYDTSCGDNQLFGVITTDTGSSSRLLTSNWPTIGPSNLTNSNNLASFWLAAYLDINTIDPTDRAGKYLSTATITVSTL